MSQPGESTKDHLQQARLVHRSPRFPPKAARNRYIFRDGKARTVNILLPTEPLSLAACGFRNFRTPAEKLQPAKNCLTGSTPSANA